MKAKAIEDKFAAAAASSVDLTSKDEAGEVRHDSKVATTKTAKDETVKTTSKSSVLSGGKSKTSVTSVASLPSKQSSSLASRSLASNGKRSVSGGQPSAANTEKSGFRPGNKLSKDQSERILPRRRNN